LTLGDFEEIPESPIFPHTQAFPDQYKKITEYIRTNGGFIVMSNGEQIPIARNKRQEFIDLCMR
jgi:two-component system LytT family response regulator